MYDVVVSIPLPEGPEAVLYSVTVTVENGDGDQGHPVEADAYVIGPPSSVAPLSVGEVSFSKWSYEWTHPIRFWQGEASHPVVYEIEVSCSGASMTLVYDVTADLKNGIAGGEVKAEWQEGYWSGAQEVTLTPDDTVMGVAGGLSELVCYQGDDVSFRVTPRNRLFDGPTSLVTVRALAPPTQVQGLVSEEYDGGVTVSWEKPMDTGYGDGSAVVEYIVETSICPDFSETPACVYHSQVTGASSVELGRETLERGAETYYIRVTAQNEIGAGQEESVEQQFMMTVMELEVEQSGEDLQINWQYSVLDQPELKFVVSVTSSDGLMAEEMVYLVTEYTACKNDVTSGRSDSRKASKRRSSRSRVNGMVRSSSKEVRALESNGISDEATSVCTEGFTGAHCQPCGTDMYSTECSEECDMMSTCHGHGRCSGSDGQCACYS